jgi:hypothetical protein
LTVLATSKNKFHGSQRRALEGETPQIPKEL